MSRRPCLNPRLLAAAFNDSSQAPELLNGLRHPSGLINCSKQPSFALGLLLHRLCAGRAALTDYPTAWKVRDGCEWRSVQTGEQKKGGGGWGHLLPPRWHYGQHDPHLTFSISRSSPPLTRQSDDGVIAYPPIVVPLLDANVFPPDFCDLVQGLLVCSARARPTAADAMATIANLSSAFGTTSSDLPLSGDSARHRLGLNAS